MVHDHGDDDDNENNEKSNSDDLINNENNNEILNIEHSDNDYIEEITYDEGNLKENLEKKNEESKIKEKKINNIQHKHNNIENNENEINNESQIEIHNHNQHHHHHQNDNIYAIYIHILADTLGSIAVLISSYLIRFHDIKISDPICSCLISILIVYSTIPVLKNSAVILLHIPNSAIKIRKEKIKKKCDEYNDSGFIIQSIDLWMLKKNNFVCDIKIIKNNNIADNGNKKLLYKDLSKLMKELKIKEFFIDI
jgi:zinc transporter 5/7